MHSVTSITRGLLAKGFLLFFVSLLSAQELDLSGLKEEQKKEFFTTRLSIEITGESYTSGTYGRGVVSASSREWVKWMAYEGFNAISEETFFQKTNYSTLAAQAHKYRVKHLRGKRWGLGLALTGLGLDCVGLIGLAVDDDLVNTPFPAVTIGGGSLVSVVGLVIGLPHASALRRNTVPYSTVEDIAEEYNKSLLEELKRGQ